MPPFNTIDIIFAGLLLVGVLRGTLRGLSGELASLLGFVAAVFIGWKMYTPLGQYLMETTQLSAFQAETVSFITILIAIMVLLWALRIVLKRIMAVTFKGLIERIGGGVLGLIRYGLFLTALILAVSLFGHQRLREEVIDASFVGRHINEQLAPRYAQWAERHPHWPQQRERISESEREQEQEAEPDEPIDEDSW